MSIRIMSAVWGVQLPDSEKIVLLALADCANDDGVCWPSMATLARKCSKSDRTIQAAVKSLVAAGHLTRHENPGKGCRYIVHPEQGSGMQGYEPPQHHYIYRVTRIDTGEFYVGARSCLCAPESDVYMGSGRWVQAQIAAGVALQKDVVALLPSREALAHREAIETGAAITDPLCRNAKVAAAAALTRAFRPEAASPHTSATSAGRNPRGAQSPTPSPEAVSDKPSRTTISSNATHPKKTPAAKARWPKDMPPPAGVSDDQWAGFIAHRKARRSTLTERAYDLLVGKLAEHATSDRPPGAIVDLMVERGWLTFEPHWLNNLTDTRNDNRPRNDRSEPRGLFRAVVDAERESRAGPGV